jgi:hypothetical protein
MLRNGTKGETRFRARRQFSLRALLLVVMLCAIALGLASWWMRPPALHRGYFPIGAGYRWVYASKNGSSQDDIVFEVVGTEQVGEAECFVVMRTIGTSQLKFYVEVTSRGVVIHQVGEDRYAPPYRQFAFGAKAGDRWSWQGSIGGERSEYECENHGQQPVSVPYGQWEAFFIEQESRTSDTKFYLARGIGVVIIRGKSRDRHDPPAEPGESSSFDWQLKEFYRP